MALFRRRKRESWFIDPGEPWSDRVLRDIEDSDSHRAWRALIDHARESSNTYPTQTWLRASRKIVEEIGTEDFIEKMSEWLRLAAQPPADPRKSYQILNGGKGHTGQNGNILKGLVWACYRTNDPTLIARVADTARACFTKIPELGQRCTRAGNACVYTLGQVSHADAPAHLFALQGEIDYLSTQRVIDTALKVAAADRGLTVAQLRQQFGEHERSRELEAARERRESEKILDPAAQAAALLADIYANPESDELRLVYADHLLDMDDPRGEFIMLQYMEKPTRKQRSRERALLKEFRDEWLGSLEPVLLKSELAFARGFLSEARLRPRSISDAKSLIGHPAFSTVVRLSVVNQNVPGELLADPVMRSLREVEGVSLAIAIQLAKAKPATRIEKLVVAWDDYYGRTSPDLEEIVPAPGLPALRDLTLNIFRLNDQSVETLRWLFDSELGRGLERLTLPNNRQQLATRVRQLVTTPDTTPVIALTSGYGGGWTVEWHREDRHLRCCLEIEDVPHYGMRERMSPEIIQILESVPHTEPRRITLVTPPPQVDRQGRETPWLRPSEWQAIRRAAERFSELEELITPGAA